MFAKNVRTVDVMVHVSVLDAVHLDAQVIADVHVAEISIV